MRVDQAEPCETDDYERLGPPAATTLRLGPSRTNPLSKSVAHSAGTVGSIRHLRSTLVTDAAGRTRTPANETRTETSQCRTGNVGHYARTSSDPPKRHRVGPDNTGVVDPTIT